MTAQEYVPEQGDLEQLRLAAKACHGCHLYRDATQTVFGDGPGDARILVVGEQPGDIEDRRGAPFVGPAGKVLDRAFDAAGLDRGSMYVTNAVKHFKHRPAAPGKRRIHQTPDRTEIVACRPWLVAEFDRIRPAQVVVLGATAAKAMLGPAFRVTKEHGRRLAVPAEFAAADDAVLVATIHPSAVLRADDRESAFAGLVEDLRVLAAG
ncbi:UdgX family uracil-DNA binding protein [Dactylosporangium sp. NPDC050688]|uniref:UdgX family uracil-DNA binding protein n=1 Tax=Dactylosporangium sp. NPDC050688 TaxID=3157217 RepID=UPI0033CC1AAC